jgi:hypothetical protein
MAFDRVTVNPLQMERLSSQFEERFTLTISSNGEADMQLQQINGDGVQISYRRTS